MSLSENDLAALPAAILSASVAATDPQVKDDYFHHAYRVGAALAARNEARAALLAADARLAVLVAHALTTSSVGASEFVESV